MSLIKTLLLLLAFLYFGIGTALYFFQRSFIYFPTLPMEFSGLSNVYRDHGDIRLQGHVANAEQSQLILYFGGNAEQIGSSLQELALHFPQYSVAGFHYRGYAGSNGEPSEQALISDALFLYEQMAKEYEKVVVMGRSLGSGVATQLASKRKVDALVLVTPFDSITAVAAKVYWFYPISWMITERYNSLAVANSITAPTLLLMAADDRVITADHSEKLLSGFTNGVATAVTIANSGHNSIADNSDYFVELKKFLR